MRRLLLCLFSFLRAGLARADGCDPRNFLINSGATFDAATQPELASTNLAGYCDAPSIPPAGGGPGNNWAWGGIPSRCMYAAKDSCQCASQWKGVLCECRSSYETYIQMCYTSYAKCPSDCNAGEYVSGCGCVDCRNRVDTSCGTITKADGSETYNCAQSAEVQAQNQADYDARMSLYANSELFNFGGQSCTGDGFRTGYLCGYGTCKACPLGFYCPDKQRAVPCPAGTYANTTGSTQCTPCTLITPAGGACLTTGSVATQCDAKKGFDPTVLTPCGDGCTALPAGRSLTSNTLDTCTCRGITPGKVLVKNVCTNCVQCTGVYFARPTNAPYYCVASQAECTLMYYSKTDGTSNYECHSTNAIDQTTQSYMACTGLDDESKIVSGQMMPWVQGRSRTLPPDSWRYIAGTAQKGMVPYYAHCAVDPPPAPYTWRTGSNTLLNALRWDEVPGIDCVSFYAYQCLAEHVAVLSSETKAPNMPDMLEECRPCGANGHSAGGLVTQCVCDDGFGNLAKIEELLKVPVMGVRALSAEQTCLNCFTDVLFNHVAVGQTYTEALACTKNTISRCDSSEWGYVRNQQCQSCWTSNATSPPSICSATPAYTPHVPRPIPLLNRTDCMLCPPGKFIVPYYAGVYQCQACANDEYQPASGQCGCLKRRTHCDAGQQLVLRDSFTIDLTADAECQPCMTKCPQGQITVYSDPKHASDGSTCDGRGFYFFGCYAVSDLETLGPDTAAGHRLAFPESAQSTLQSTFTNESPQRVLLQPCNPVLLPPNSRFVAYYPTNSVGLECYFACLYGVDSKVASQYHAAIRSYATSSNPQLLPFMPDDARQSQLNKASVKVPMTWSVQTAKATSDARPSVWTVYDEWLNSGKGGAPLTGNTFLYDEAFLPIDASLVVGLCLTPAQAYTSQCPVGVRQQQATPECALLARTHSLTVSLNAQTAMAVLPNTSYHYDDSGVVECMADAVGYTGFRVGCTRSCLDDQLEGAQLLAESLQPGTLWHERSVWALFLISPVSWYLYYSAFVPYAFPNYYALLPASSMPGTNGSNSTMPILLSMAAPFSVGVSGGSGAYDTCATQCAWNSATYKTFRYDPSTAHAQLDEGQPNMARDLQALLGPVCVPCDQTDVGGGIALSFGTSICYLFSPTRYYDNDVCLKGVPGVTELTTSHVCSECPLTKANATLIDARLEPHDWQAWYTVRASTYGLSQQTNQWDTPCRYRCAVGYASNENGLAAYTNRPCLPCDSFACETQGRAMYYTANTDCGIRPNFEPLGRHCATCDSNVASEKGHARFLFQTNLFTPVALFALCPAICHPDYYQTYYRNDNDVLEFVSPGQYRPVGRLSCVNCATGDANYPCAGACRQDYYNPSVLNPLTTGCVRCNTSACPEGQYREQCRVGTAASDAQCIKLTEASLSNPSGLPIDSIGPSHPAYRALNRSRGRSTRRWLTQAERTGASWWVAAFASPVPEQTAMVCRNNYAWLDARSGLSPWTNATTLVNAAWLFCVACADLNTDGTDRRLYSFWNASNASTIYAQSVTGVNPTLESMTWGGCFGCYDVRDVVESSTALCELPPGHSGDAQAASLIEITVPGSQSLASNMQATDALVIQSATEEHFVYYLDLSQSGVASGGRRRLLQLNPVDAMLRPVALRIDAPHKTLLTLPAQRLPLLLAGMYFSCCDALPSAQDASDCRALQGTQSLNRIAYTGGIQGPCAGLPRQRRLLQQPTSDTRCAFGTYKPQRGDAPCAICQTSATTSGVATYDARDCQCMPGHYAPINGTCAPCPNGTYRGIADADCRPCPSRFVTLGVGATACVCVPGTYYSSFARECLDCLPNHHCADGKLVPCPLHGLSPKRAISIADCVCDPSGFYGDLALPNGVCYPMTPGLNPNGTCARGWTQVRVDAQWIHCASGCANGTYAHVEPRTRALLGCVSCPPDTYATDGTLVDACTDCPLGRGTAGRSGQTSLSACRCLAGVDGANSSDCAGCGAAFYFDPLERACLACPDGWVSAANSVGVSACQCPPGQYAAGDVCRPCPIGTYSHSIGMTCTPCPSGCTTKSEGQTAYAACYCGSVVVS